MWRMILLTHVRGYTAKSQIQYNNVITILETFQKFHKKLKINGKYIALDFEVGKLK